MVKVERQIQKRLFTLYVDGKLKSRNLTRAQLALQLQRAGYAEFTNGVIRVTTRNVIAKTMGQNCLFENKDGK